jgi:hypothetical protein
MIINAPSKAGYNYKVFVHSYVQPISSEICPVFRGDVRCISLKSASLLTLHALGTRGITHEHAQPSRLPQIHGVSNFARTYGRSRRRQGPPHVRTHRHRKLV